MRRWVASLGVLAVGVLNVDAARYTTFALWPQQIDATLALSENADGLPLVEASHGGALGTFHMKVDTKSEVELDPLIDAIEITWVPAANAQSSTFDRFLAHSSRVDGMISVGIHLHVKLRHGSSWSVINETHHERIERNVHRMLQNILPSMEILPHLAEGFLAKSMCDFHTWKMSHPLEKNLRDPVSTLCYSSSFGLSSENGVLFNSKIVEEAKAGLAYFGDSVVENSLFEVDKNLWTFQHEHKLAVMKIGRGPASSVEAEYLEARIASLSDGEKIWKTLLPLGEVTTDAFVVKSIARGFDVDKLEYVWLQRDGKSVEAGTPPSNAETGVLTASIAASIQTDIAGEGFHRQFVMEVEILESEVCGNASRDQIILVLVPVSKTAYIDLDEIRRMERFGKLKLLSFTKHIEIERPSPVSSQHVVGLEFTMSSTNKVHIEFPIHFRYQAPSESTLYRQAFVITPDIFLSCQDGDQSAMKDHTLLGDDTVRSYFQAWGLSSQEGLGGGNRYWLRLHTATPLPVTEVLTPVGYLPSRGLVSSVTLLFASMGAALLLWVSVGVAKRSQIPVHAANWKGKAD